MMEIIDPIDRALIEKELTDEVFVRPTNNGGNQLFIIDLYLLLIRVIFSFLGITDYVHQICLLLFFPIYVLPI